MYLGLCDYVTFWDMLNTACCDLVCRRVDGEAAVICRAGRMTHTVGLIRETYPCDLYGDVH